MSTLSERAPGGVAVAGTAEMKALFDRDGYYVARDVLPIRAVAALRGAFDAQARMGRHEALNVDARITDPGDPLYVWGRMMHPHRFQDLEIGRLALKYMLHPAYGRILETLLGEPAIAAQSMYYFKPPGARGQDFHQDNFYLRVRPGTCVAAWASIDDSDQENGGLMVVPGSHKFGIVCPEASDPTRFFSTEHLDIPAGYEAVPVDLKAGDVLFFNGSVIDGSYPNNSQTRFRRSFICHYVPRSSEEVSRFYKPLLTFDGRAEDRVYVSGGGPCGTLQDAVKAPH